MGELSEQHKRVLDFEGRMWLKAGPKEDAMRAEFGWSSTEYYQVLAAVVNDPAALVYSPILVNRLRRANARSVAPRN